MSASVKVGDVFYRSWGYNQTQVDFYEVVSVSASGKSAKARKIKAQAVEGSNGGRVVAAQGEGRFVEKSRCARCSNYHEGEQGWDGHAFSAEYGWSARSDWVTVGKGEHAYRWDGKSKHQTGWYETGH